MFRFGAFRLPRASICSAYESQASVHRFVRQSIAGIPGIAIEPGFFFLLGPPSQRS